MMRGLMILAAAGLVAGCATTDAADDAAPAPMACNAEAAQAHVGKTALPEVGAAILKDSGARMLRWGPAARGRDDGLSPGPGERAL